MCVLCKVWDLFGNWFGLGWSKPRHIEDWMLESLNGWGLKGKAKVLWFNVVKAILWLIWKEGNARIFKDKYSSIAYFCNLIVHDL